MPKYSRTHAGKQQQGCYIKAVKSSMQSIASSIGELLLYAFVYFDSSKCLDEHKPDEVASSRSFTSKKYSYMDKENRHAVISLLLCSQASFSVHTEGLVLTRTVSQKPGGFVSSK